jgi:putative membrane protein
MSPHAPRILVSALATLFMAGTAVAQTTGAAGTGTTSRDSGDRSTTSGAARSDTARSAKLARADESFLKQADQNGLAEVESSKLALTKAQNQQVKAFAQQMVDDHTKANDELKALAQSKGVELPNQPSLAQRAKMKLLEKSDPENFDRRYIEQMGVEAHEDTVELFQKAAREARDADVKSYASTTLPKLQEHLKMAQDLKAVTDKDGSASASGTRKQQ